MPSTGLAERLAYSHRGGGWAAAAIRRVAATRPGAWFFAHTLHRADEALRRLSRGRVSMLALAGLSPLFVTSTGARTGLARTVPLVGVPIDGGIGLIGTNFGQARTPGWVHNLLATPEVVVASGGRSAPARARLAAEHERHHIWERARSLYVGYDAYARRIGNRHIRVFVLEALAD
jgi:deazaflavin-dependent oxidoreductase (nitroreductase family)